jgi:hypothetical protein
MGFSMDDLPLGSPPLGLRFPSAFRLLSHLRGVQPPEAEAPELRGVLDTGGRSPNQRKSEKKPGFHHAKMGL